MSRLFFSLVIGGIGIANTLDAAIHSYPWIALLFAALTAIVLIPAWLDLRKLSQVEPELKAAEHEAAMLKDTTFTLAADNLNYVRTLIEVRDLLTGSDVINARRVVINALKEQPVEAKGN
jgi:hypothetical protein